MSKLKTPKNMRTSEIVLILSGRHVENESDLFPSSARFQELCLELDRRIPMPGEKRLE